MLPMMSRWEIIDGPHRPENEGSVDGELWIATIGNVNDPAQRRLISVTIARTARDSDPATLPFEVRRALETDARTAVEATLNDEQPPDRISISTSGINAEQ